MEYTTLRVEREGAVETLTLDRPDRLNGITGTMVRELGHYWQSKQADVDTQVVVLQGAGRAFCAGLDIKEQTADGDRPTFRPGERTLSDLAPLMRRAPQPILALLHGGVSGGGFAMALASDIRICSNTAKFATSFIRLGLSGCDIGVSWMLPRLIGASRSHELLLTGRVFDAAEADALGLVTRVVEPDQLLESAFETARLIAGNSPFGVWMTKEVMWSNLEVGSLQAGIDMENRTQILSSGTEDSRAAMAGFLGGEPIDWQNR